MDRIARIALGLILMAALPAIGAVAQPASAPASQPAATQATSQPASPAATAHVFNETCPIMNLPSDREIHVDYQGQRVYFCCAACPRMFTNNPDRYLDRLPQFAPAAEHGEGEGAPGHPEAAGHEGHAGHEHSETH
jgi:YHS domain-containing protein